MNKIINGRRYNLFLLFVTKCKILLGEMTIQPLTKILLIEQDLIFPTEHDLKGAAIALAHLQDVYNLNASSLIKRQVNGITYSAKLSPADCFELGHQLHKSYNFNYGQMWITEAFVRLEEELESAITSRNLLEYLHFLIYKKGSISSALDHINELLKVHPGYTNIKGRKSGLLKNCHHNKKIFLSEMEVTEVYNIYMRLCRGETLATIEITSNLKCRYLTNNNPFLLIAPFKVEEASADPEILIFHDVIFDHEIRTIQTLALPRFQRSTIFSSDKGYYQSNRKIGKTAWVHDGEHVHIANIDRRVQDMTGLSVESAESFQVVNYGIGGYHTLHLDVPMLPNPTTLEFVNFAAGRITTLLFYINDVVEGGATVFPKLKTAIWPKKGSAAFWYNLQSNGNADLRTYHASCPVLVGTKWIANKWLHTEGQEFLKPCELTPPNNLNNHT